MSASSSASDAYNMKIDFMFFVVDVGSESKYDVGHSLNRHRDPNPNNLKRDHKSSRPRDHLLIHRGFMYILGSSGMYDSGEINSGLSFLRVIIFITPKYVHARSYRSSAIWNKRIYSVLDCSSRLSCVDIQEQRMNEPRW